MTAKWPGANDNETLKRQQLIVDEAARRARGKRILNIGDTRKSYITKALGSKGFDVTTIDLFADADVVMDFDGKKFPDSLAGKFDCVTTGEIIEHLVYTDVFLDQIYRCLKPNGVLVMSFPNICCLKNRVKMLFGKFPTYGAAKLVHPQIHNDDKFHVRDFNLEKITEFLDAHRLRIESVSTNGIYVRDKLLLPGSVCPPTLGNQIVVTAMKK
ncbi:MAG: methyltransferase domain-containing protein [Candidatus Aenigmarchaeota archaeon]|nr:methyltransferase domain-containing protein [Candidatus Aenigmarchaeota archaeon]